MAQTLTPYSPANVFVDWGSFLQITGFAEGTSIDVVRNTDNTTSVVGMQGDVGITLNADRTGTVTITLMQTSFTNRMLARLQSEQETSGELIRADLNIKDLSGSMLTSCYSCHIMTPPNQTLGDSQEAKTWVFYCEEIAFKGTPSGVFESDNTTARMNAAVSAAKTESEKLASLLV